MSDSKRAGWRVITAFHLSLSLSVLVQQTASAASIAQTSVDAMLEASAFVFEGRVVGKRARELRVNAAQRITIHTLVTFEVVDVIKSPPDGPRAGRTLTLSFLGGEVGDKVVVVHDMQVPELGERGVYFVESLERRQVNPLYGWAQGHFLIERDGAQDRVTTADRKRIGAVARASGLAPRHLSRGIASGIDTDATAASMTAVEFKRKLRDMLRTMQ